MMVRMATKHSTPTKTTDQTIEWGRMERSVVIVVKFV
jgi:hypothetical protein